MKASTQRLVFGLVFFGAIVYLLLPDDGPHKTSHKKPKVAMDALALNGRGFTKADFDSHFTLVDGSVRNAFNPLIKVISNSTRTGTDKYELSQSLAGEANWVFSGLAVVDSEKMAIMENRSTHESALVREGGMFKTSRVLRITRDGIAFLNSKGIEETVLRFIGEDAFKAAQATDLGLQPLSIQPALSGMISSGNGDQPISLRSESK